MVKQLVISTNCELAFGSGAEPGTRTIVAPDDITSHCSMVKETEPVNRTGRPHSSTESSPAWRLAFAALSRRSGIKAIQRRMMQREL